ncbi:MAG: protoporphyrinogen oxidase [Pyrinomonadaceae bacterium]
MSPKSKIQNPKSKIVIVGGGLSGLAAAFRLQELRAENNFDSDFLLLEAGNRLGGTIQSVHREGFLLEFGADAFLSEKPEAVALAKRLGIERELVPTNDENRRAFLVRHNKLRPIPAGFRLIAPADVPAFFGSEILSRHGKIRLANERFLPPKSAAYGDETLADFVRRRFGSEALERIAQPMFAGIYTADPEKLSMMATQPHFLKLEQKYGSVIRGLEETAKQPNAQYPTSRIEKSAIRNPESPIEAAGARYSLFLSFQNGMQTLLDALASKLPEDFFRLTAQAQTVCFDMTNRLWRIKLENGEQIDADAVCLALPAHKIAELLQNQFPLLASELAEVEYASSATVNLAFRRDQIAHELNGFGFVVPFVERRTLMAGTFSSVKFAGRAPERQVLLRAFVGGALQPDKFALNDEEMIAGTLQDLRELIGLTGKPLFAQVARWARSMPQYHLGHLEKAARVTNLLAEIPSLALATTAFDGVGIPDSIRHGETAAQKLADNLVKSELKKRLIQMP